MFSHRKNYFPLAESSATKLYRMLSVHIKTSQINCFAMAECSLKTFSRKPSVRKNISPEPSVR
jgi:hypothetical protein